MSDLKAHGVNFVKRKSSTKKKKGFVVVVEGLGLLRYFRNINILGFILYSTLLCNYSHIHNKVFSYTHSFFSQGVPRKFDVFLCFRILLLCH